MYPITSRISFWHITLKDILVILCAAALPLALALYSSTMQKQHQKIEDDARQADIATITRTRQQTLYDQFLDNIYQLDKNGYLAENETPWAFANAFYRSTHRHLDSIRKGDLLQFLKERELIGRSICSKNCQRRDLPDIIRLNKLNLEHVHLKSQTDKLNTIKLNCVKFDQVLFNHAIFSFVDLNGAIFTGGQSKYVKFDGSSLRCATFDGVDLQGVDFGDSDFTGIEFHNVDLTTVKLTDDQIKQATFYNCKLPKGMFNSVKLPETTESPKDQLGVLCPQNSTGFGSIRNKSFTTQSPMMNSTGTNNSALSTVRDICTDSRISLPIGSCIDIYGDFCNCGSIDHVCPSNSTRCSRGLCGSSPLDKFLHHYDIHHWNGSELVDDELYSITSPFPVILFNETSTNISLTTNGVICLFHCSYAHANTNLPSISFVGPTVFAYWDDLVIYPHRSQYVHYDIDGMHPNRTLHIVVYESHYSNATYFYEFQVIFYENAPGIVTIIYFQATDNGASATIGVQKSSNGPSIEYSYDKMNAVVPNRRIIFNTNFGNYSIN